jgi:hypothetical protein
MGLKGHPKKEDQMLSKNEMRLIINEIIEIGNQLRRYHELDDIPAKAFSAPNKVLFSDFKERFAGKLPPSYLQLMSIYNGVENLEWVDVSILPIEFIMEHDNLDEDWVDAGVYEEGDLFIFAQSGSDALSVAFLLKTADHKGEMEVVHFDAGGLLGKYKNFEEYLRARCDWLKNAVANEEADRKGLTDDA